MVIGGFAVIARGVKRMTTDVDLAVQGDAIAIGTLADALERHGIVERIDDAVAFARSSLVLLLRDRKSGVHIDLSFAWSPFEHEALAQSELRRIGDVELPVARTEDLVIYKVVAGRPHDMKDAETLLLLYPEVDRARIEAHTRALAEMAETPEMVERLRALLATVKKSRSRR